MKTATKALAFHQGRSALLQSSKRDLKVPSHQEKQIFSNTTIPTKNIRMTVTLILTSLSQNDFQDMALSTERYLNIIQQATTTLSRITTAIQK